jgi:hypothetical protein
MVDKKLLDPYIEDALLDIDTALKQQMTHLIKAGDIDQLHGALGIARYFLKRGKNSDVSTVVNHLFDSRIDSNHEIKWRKEHLVKKGAFHYDLGLAHGVAGIIYFLMKCYKNGIETEKAKLLIDGSIRFLLNNEKEFTTIGSDFASSFFCDEYDTSAVTPVKSRLAWCYGDLTIWYTLLNAAILFENDGLRAKAIEGLLRSGTRTDSTDSSIVDANFCHGSAGVSYIFQKAYLTTGITEFEEVSLYWLKKTMDFDSGTDMLPGYQFLTGNWEGRKFNQCPDLLEGMAGVGITYLLRLFPHLNDWDECMMLS